MTDRLLFVRESDLKEVLDRDLSPTDRSVLVANMVTDAPSSNEVEADALVDAAEVIKLRISKRIAPIVAMEGKLGMKGYMMNWMRSGHREVMVLTIETIMYRWLMARSEAIRSKDAVV